METSVRRGLVGSQMLGSRSAVHLDELGAVTVTTIESGVQGGHRAALAGPQYGVYSGTVVEENFAHVEIAVKSRHVEGRLAVVGRDVQGAGTFLREPLDELDAPGDDRLVRHPGSTDRPRVQRTSVLSEDLQRLQLALRGRAECRPAVHKIQTNLHLGIIVRRRSN